MKIFTNGYLGIGGDGYHMVNRLCVPATFESPPGVESSFLCTPVENQGQNPVCAAVAGTTNVEVKDWQKHHYKNQLDYMALYNRAKVRDGNTNPGTYGTSIFDAMRDLKYIDPLLARMQILKTQQELQFALHAHQVCMVAVRLTAGWLPGNLVKGWVGEQSEYIGNHMMMLCGYRRAPYFARPGYKVLQSWGSDVGENGFVKVDADKLEAGLMEGYLITW